MKFSEIELGKRYQIQRETTQLPMEGIIEIGKYLKSRYSFSWYGNAVGQGYISFEKQSDDKEYRGNLTTQVSKFMMKVLGIKITDEDKSEIGNIANRYFSKPGKYEFDFTDKIDWEAGEFGDGGSCYWGGRSIAKEVLMQNHVWAIRFYNPETSKGIGRCWLSRLSDETGIIWNGYGPSDWGDALLEIKKILSEFMAMNSQRITLDNNGNDSGLVYINSGRGYIISENQEGQDDYYDFGYDAPECYCEECGEYLDDDRSYVHNESVYCEDCYYELYCICDKCHESCNIEDAYRLDDGYLCPGCFHKYGAECENCHEYIYQNDMQIVQHDDDSGDTESWCDYCVRRRASQCPQCNEIFIDMVSDICSNCEKKTVEISGDPV